MRGWRRAACWAALGTLLLALRLPTLGWGLPNALHPDYSYHPDEGFFSRWADDFAAGERFRKLFMYGGTAFFAAVALTNRAADALVPDAEQPLAARILAGRVANVVVAFATAAAIAAAAGTLYGRRTALLAALLWTLYLGPLALGQWLRPDGLFSLAFALHLCVVARLARHGPTRATLPVLALTLGAATALRFPALVWGLGWLPALRRHAPRVAPWRWTLSAAAALGCAALASFALFSPSLVSELPRVLDGVRAQYAQQRGAFAENFGAGPSAWHYAGPALVLASSLALYPWAVCGTLFALWRRRWADRVVLAVCAPYAALLAVSNWAMMAYLLPLLPATAILSARVACVAARGRARRWTWAALGTCAALALVVQLAYLRAVAPIDPRDATLAWMSTHLPRGTDVAVFQRYAGDVFWHPPAHTAYAWRACALTRCDAGAFLATRPAVVIIERGFLASLSSRAAPRTAASYRALRDWHAAPPGYRRLAGFGQPFTLFGWQVGVWPAFGPLRGPLPQLEIWARDGLRAGYPQGEPPQVVRRR